MLVERKRVRDQIRGELFERCLHGLGGRAIACTAGQEGHVAPPGEFDGVQERGRQYGGLAVLEGGELVLHIGRVAVHRLHRGGTQRGLDGRLKNLPGGRFDEVVVLAHDQVCVCACRHACILPYSILPLVGI